ncbi:SAV_915 family protein [Microbacterium sp. 18062]|uniref:SAV_915 family protein n=1 Tax=Microbacterium sp. 18062 TaxID=2681410 RepID=UPI001F1F69C7|nr:SAV_915 family protein [Microbacterium sp. 18062]
MASRVRQDGQIEQPEVIVPPVLYLPIVDNPDSEGQMAVVRRLADGRRGLLAYTALDRLADKCGPDQPWMLLMTSELGRIKAGQPFDVVAFDLEIPRSERAGGRLA